MIAYFKYTLIAVIIVLVMKAVETGIAIVKRSRKPNDE